MGHGNLVQVCEVRAYLSDTHTAGDKCISLYKQPNATNTAVGHPGSNTFGPSYQRKPANTHACCHTSNHPHCWSETAVTIVNSPLNLGPLYLNYIYQFFFYSLRSQTNLHKVLCGSGRLGLLLIYVLCEKFIMFRKYKNL